MATRRNSRQTARQRRSRSLQKIAAVKVLSSYGRKLRYEPLESRDLLAVVTVNTALDTVDFYDGLTSLREAIFATNTVPGADVIQFAPSITANGPATILLTQGELRILDSVTIAGPGAGLLTIDASGSDPTTNSKNGDGSRIFNIDDGTAAVIDVSIADLTLTGGDALERGGAILTMESLELADCVVTDNYVHANNTATGGGLAAILRDGASLVVTRTIISNNMAATGGGIWLDVGAGCLASIAESQISENATGPSAFDGIGGGIRIRAEFGGVAITDTIIKDNSSTNVGGGVFFAGYVTVERSVIMNNSATNSGGGIQHNPTTGGIVGALTLIDSEVRDNSARSAGGIRLAGSPQGALPILNPHKILRSRIVGNVAEGGTVGGFGGGILLDGGSLELIESTIDSNFSGGSGGGLYASPSAADLWINRSTFSYNHAENYGGALAVHNNYGFAMNREIVVRHSTLSSNTGHVGAGIYATVGLEVAFSTVTRNTANLEGGAAYIQKGALQINHSILANNFVQMGSGDVSRGATATIAATYSLIGDNTGSGIAEAPVGMPDANGNLVGGALNGAIDPLLRPLGDYGGPTLTHALTTESPALNAGNPAAQAGIDGIPLHDQRGEPFGRIVSGRIDIGALELREQTNMPLVVSILTDESDGEYSANDLSLREALQLANLDADSDTIYFASHLIATGPATILLLLGDLRILSDTTLVGLGADQLTIDASGSDINPGLNDGYGSRIFTIDDASDSLIDVAITGLTLTGGNSQYGGAVLSSENLTITTSKITGNHASSFGGGIVALYGRLEVIDSYVSSNNGSDSGGGIGAVLASVLIQDSTISGNSAHAGGGVHGYGSHVSIIDSEIAQNTVAGLGSLGGGIFSKYGLLSVTRSIITGNTAGGGAGVYSEGEAEIVDSHLDGNIAERNGGAVYSFGRLDVRRTTISSNSAALDGGGMHAKGDILIDSSALAHNSSDRHGGGLWLEMEDGSAHIVNTTISGNSAGVRGGGLWLYGSDTPTVISHSTVTQNAAGISSNAGGGIYLYAGFLAIDHTIVATNYADVESDISVGDELEPQLVATFSLIGSNSNTGLTPTLPNIPDENGNLIGSDEEVLDPLLAPFADNGGPTPTHALLSGSPAINAGDPTAIAGSNGVPLFDQRGEPYSRIVNDRIDIGAVEYRSTPVVGDYNLDGTVDGADYVVWRKFLSTPNSDADGDGSGTVDEPDYSIWEENYQPAAQTESLIAFEELPLILHSAIERPSEDFGVYNNRFLQTSSAQRLLQTLIDSRALARSDARADSMRSDVLNRDDDRGEHAADSQPRSLTALLSSIDAVFASIGSETPTI